MKLEEYNFPEVTTADLAFPTFDAPKELVKEAGKRDVKKGVEKFNELFYSGGTIEFQKDVKGTWKENAFMFAKSLMGSYAPRHEQKEVVCGMIFQETLVL